MVEFSLSRHRVLLVDDDRTLLMGLFRTLRRRFDIQVAASAEIALDVIRDNAPFDVIVCDWRMPGLDGMAFLERARFMAPFAIRIMISGAPENPMIVDPEIAAFFHAFIPKPCPPDALIAAIDHALYSASFSGQ